MEVVKLIRPEPVVIRLIRQPNGPVQLIRSQAKPVRLVANRGPVIFVSNASSAQPVTLPVTANGQTVWDLGLAEYRRNLWVNGLRYFEGTDYTIALPLLTWHGSFVLKTHFQVVLT